jgi:hypothetical protein
VEAAAQRLLRVEAEQISAQDRLVGAEVESLFAPARADREFRVAVGQLERLAAERGFGQGGSGSSNALPPNVASAREVSSAVRFVKYARTKSTQAADMPATPPKGSYPPAHRLSPPSAALINCPKRSFETSLLSSVVFDIDAVDTNTSQS